MDETETPRLKLISGEELREARRTAARDFGPTLGPKSPSVGHAALADAQRAIRAVSMAPEGIRENLIERIDELLEAVPGGGTPDDALRSMIPAASDETGDGLARRFARAILTSAMEVDDVVADMPDRATQSRGIEAAALDVVATHLLKLGNVEQAGEARTRADIAADAYIARRNRNGVALEPDDRATLPPHYAAKLDLVATAAAAVNARESGLAAGYLDEQLQARDGIPTDTLWRDLDILASDRIVADGLRMVLGDVAGSRRPNVVDPRDGSYNERYERSLSAAVTGTLTTMQTTASQFVAWAVGNREPGAAGGQRNAAGLADQLLAVFGRSEARRNAIEEVAPERPDIEKEKSGLDRERVTNANRISNNRISF